MLHRWDHDTIPSNAVVRRWLIRLIAIQIVLWFLDRRVLSMMHGQSSTVVFELDPVDIDQTNSWELDEYIAGFHGHDSQSMICHAWPGLWWSSVQSRSIARLGVMLVATKLMFEGSKRLKLAAKLPSMSLGDVVLSLNGRVHMAIPLPFCFLLVGEHWKCGS